MKYVHMAHQGTSSMINRVDDCVFWPSIHTDIMRTRQNCMTCHKEAPSQQAGYPVAPPAPQFPFQQIAADYFTIQGANFLVIVDRFSGWFGLYGCPDGEFSAKKFIEHLRDHCMTFSIPEEISTDGGQQFMAHDVQMFFQKFGIRHRLSSAYFPHSNSRAELAVKSAKRMLRDNLTADGKFSSNKMMAAILQFRNTPLQDCRRSPAQMVFGRYMRDLLPAVKTKYEPMKDYFMSHELRERMLAKRREQDGERLLKGTRGYDQLPEGTEVLIKNQMGQVRSNT